MKTIVVLTGAGISTESGMPTYRGKEGLWEGHKLEDIATPMAFERDPETVLRFYNLRRQHLDTVHPNAAHIALAQLEKGYKIHLITQNVDDLHERGGSTQVLHLHGQLKQGRSARNPAVVVPLRGDIQLGDKAPDGAQLRPNVVWFHEPVPLMEEAIQLSMQADIFLVVGTSLVVYPAASLLNFAPKKARLIVVDPSLPAVAKNNPSIEGREGPASVEVPKLVAELLEEATNV